MTKTFKWTVEFTVSEKWVADGFDLTDDRAQDIIQSVLGWATETEVQGRVISAPDPRRMAKAQGFASVEAMQAA